MKGDACEVMMTNKDAEKIAERAKQAHDELEHYRKMINKVLDADKAQEESKDQTLNTQFTATAIT